MFDKYVFSMTDENTDQKTGQDNADYIMQFNETKYTEVLAVAHLWQRGIYFDYAHFS